MKVPGRKLSLMCFVALHACTVSTPVRLSTPKSAALPEAVSLHLGASPDPMLADFGQRLAGALGQGGVTVRDDAPYRLTLALSAQPSISGVTSDGGSDAKAVAWTSAPRRKGLLENCAAERLRAVAVGSPRLDASPPLVAQAELDTCTRGPGELDRLAQGLASAIMHR